MTGTDASRMGNPPLLMITLFQVQLKAVPRKLSLSTMVADNCRWSGRQETGSHSFVYFRKQGSKLSWGPPSAIVLLLSVLGRDLEVGVLTKDLATSPYERFGILCYSWKRGNAIWKF